MSKRIWSLSSLFLLTCFAVFADETIETVKTLVISVNDITKYFVISMYITQFILALFFARLQAQVNSLNAAKKEKEEET